MARAGSRRLDGDEPAAETTWEETVVQPGNGGVLVVYNGGAAGAGWDPAPAHTAADTTVAVPAVGALERLFPGLEAVWTRRA